MNSLVQKIFSSKLITIVILITFLITGSSVIYAKKDPINITNQPHDFNEFICGTRADHSLHSKAILIHAENLKRISDLQLSPSVSADFDDGDVAVIVDDGTLIRQPAANPVDLDGLTLLFTPNASGGYDVDTVAFSFDLSFGTNVGAGDDTNHEFNLTGGFSFSYFDTTWTNIWVRSNGNVTFGAIGNPSFFAPSDFGLQLPMIAAFFGDLDPSAGGSVHAKEELMKFTVTWNAVPEFGVSNSNTLQLVLNDDGSFQITYNGIGMILPSGSLTVGFNSGRANAIVQAVDFSAVPIAGANIDIMSEFFKPLDLLPTIDAIAIFNKFYETHVDIYDQLVFMTNFSHSNGIVAGAGAFHLGISNSVQGINRSQNDVSSIYGSAGRLKSYLWMNQIAAWPSDPYNRILNTGNSFLSVMGQESGHRWNSFLRFDQGSGLDSLLLGRGFAHWSTFLGFELSSTMDGGNNWVEISPNTYENKSFVDYFSNLDQYAIGFRAPEEVPPFFYISSASNNTIAARTPGTVLPGTVASGTRVEVTIEEVIAAEGPRIPARDSAQKDYHQAFILLVQQGTLPSNAEISQVQLYTDEWRKYWNVATDGRSTMSTNLATELNVAAVEGVVKDVSTNMPVENLLAINLETGVNQTVAAGGYYTWRTLADSVGEPDRMSTQIISAFPYIPDTSVVCITFNSTITKNINLTKLATGSIAGTITDSNTGASVEARVLLHAFSKPIGPFDLEVMTNGSGGYSFADLYVTHPGVIRYEGISVIPDFPYNIVDIGEVVVEEGIVTTADISINVADLLLVNDDPNGGYSNYYTDALDTLNVTYYPWFTAERGAAPAERAATETEYPIVIWYTGDETVNSISAAEEESLIAFLDTGGRLFLTGQNIVENLPTTSTLLTNYLQVSHGGNSTRTLVATVTALTLNGDPSTFYDKPIAILFGPGTLSAGDIEALRLKFHPTSRAFGRPSNGAFTLSDEPSLGNSNWSFKKATGNAFLAADHTYLAHTSVSVDEEIWLEVEDVANGEDTVVKRAMEWMNELVYSHDANVDNVSALAGSEMINLVTKIHNPNSHSLLVQASLESDSFTIDSIELFDDGLHGDGSANDGLWGADFLAPINESHFRVNIETIDTDSSISRMLPIATRFTTIGPIEYESHTLLFDTIPNPGDDVIFKLSLINQGSSISATDLTVKLSSTDSCVIVINELGINNYNEIAAGEIFESPGAYKLSLNELCSGTEELRVDIAVISERYLYWTDSLKIQLFPVGVDEETVVLPYKNILSNAYPNPFNPSTTIEYELAETGKVQLIIYNMLGQEVTRLVDGTRTAGKHNVVWDASRYSSGIYFYRMTAEGFSETRKLILLK